MKTAFQWKFYELVSNAVCLFLISPRPNFGITGGLGVKAYLLLYMPNLYCLGDPKSAIFLYIFFTLNNLTVDPCALWGKSAHSQSLWSVCFSGFPVTPLAHFPWYLGSDILLHTVSPQAVSIPLLFWPRHKQHKSFPSLAHFSEIKE